jgi:outer membrane murein-binding lipoprotein Lpp
MNVSGIAAALTAVVLVTGCNDKKAAQISDLTTKYETCRQEIERLSNENNELRQKVAAIGANKDKAVKLAELKDFVDATLTASMSNKVTEIVDAVFAQRVGTQDDIEAIFQDVLKEQITAKENEKRAKLEQDREKRRTEGEARHKKWETQRMEKMAGELGLTPEQTEQVSVITRESSTAIRNAMSNIMNEKGMDIEAMAEARRKASEERNARMKEVLSEEQFNSYTNLQDAPMRMMQNFFREIGGNAQGSKPNAQPANPIQ